MVGNMTMILPIQPLTASPKAPRSGAVVGFVEHKPALIVGEPDNELLLLIGADADQLLGDILDAELLLR